MIPSPGAVVDDLERAFIDFSPILSVVGIVAALFLRAILNLARKELYGHLSVLRLARRQQLSDASVLALVAIVSNEVASHGGRVWDYGLSDSDRRRLDAAAESIVADFKAMERLR